jgi:hypothetical protein
MRRELGARHAVNGLLRPPQGAFRLIAAVAGATFAPWWSKKLRERCFFTCAKGLNPYLCPCPNRTCLWSCVGWRVSGQEAGEPPENQTGSRRRTGELRLHGGSRLKATTDRAFSSLSALQRSAYRRGLSFLPGVRNGTFPFQSNGRSNAWIAHVCAYPSQWRPRRSTRSSAFASREVERSRWRWQCCISRLHRATAGGRRSSSEALLHWRAETAPFEGMPR